MQHTQRLRFHFVEHTVRRVWHEGNPTEAVLAGVRQDLGRDLTQTEALDVTNQVQYFCAEADTLLRSRIPHGVSSNNASVELWGYQQIQPLHPEIYINQHQPTQTDFTNQFQLPAGEVWVWNVVYTFTGPYYGIQTDASGQAATRSVDLGSLDFVLKIAAVLKTFPGCELLGDLTDDNFASFTLEADECRKISQVLQAQQDAIASALSPIIQGDNEPQHTIDLIQAWQVPLKTAQQDGIAQFKRGKPIQSIAV